jgi:glutaredoxin 3
MLDKSQGQHTVPQIFIDDHHIGGYSDLMELHESGALNGILLNKD